jgi:PAS domain S-box-containing protein
VPSGLVSTLIFAALAALTVVVWQQQVKHQRLLLARHTEDVCRQAARHLELFVDFRLAAARIFARRWANHEQRDYQRQRFEEFAAVLLRELPEYHALHLVSADLAQTWSVTHRGRADGLPPSPPLRALLAQARSRGGIAVSPPDADLRIFAALPLLREQTFLGFLLVELRADALIDACFRRNQEPEFVCRVQDGGRVLYRHQAEGDALDALDVAPVRSTQALTVRDRTWALTMAPRHGFAGWRENLSVPIFGLALSLSLALLVGLLLRRMDAYRRARDRALVEIAERERAQLALLASESRYRSVFDSATDGLLVIDQEGIIVEANLAACKMHGFPAGELVGFRVEELIAPQHQATYGEFVHQLTTRGAVRLDSVDQRRDGTTIDVEVRGARFRHGDAQRVLAIVTDVSERKRAEQRLTLLSRKALVAQEDERARISRELHDELGQLLTALRFELDWLRKRTPPQQENIATAFANSVELVEKAAEELRRICKGLRPPLLDDLGLEPATHLLVDEFKERTSIATEFDLQINDGQPEVPMEVALCTYRILQESLTNISRHAAARHVKIKLASIGEELHLLVSDDGRGFVAAEAGTGGSGLAGMRERASLVNGSLEITSESQKGTRVAFRVLLGGGKKEPT